MGLRWFFRRRLSCISWRVKSWNPFPRPVRPVLRSPTRSDQVRWNDEYRCVFRAPDASNSTCRSQCAVKSMWHDWSTIASTVPELFFWLHHMQVLVVNSNSWHHCLFMSQSVDGVVDRITFTVVKFVITLRRWQGIGTVLPWRKTEESRETTERTLRSWADHPFDWASWLPSWHLCSYPSCGFVERVWSIVLSVFLC